MGTVPVKLQVALIEKLDAFVRMGKFKNRSEAIRQILRQYLERVPMTGPLSDEPNINQISSVVNLMLTKKKPVFNITSRKTAAKLVKEGRER